MFSNSKEETLHVMEIKTSAKIFLVEYSESKQACSAKKSTPTVLNFDEVD